MMDPYLPDLQDPFFALPDTPMMAGAIFAETLPQGGENLMM